jgi:hypothetical protein
VCVAVYFHMAFLPCWNSLWRKCMLCPKKNSFNLLNTRITITWWVTNNFPRNR